MAQLTFIGMLGSMLWRGVIGCCATVVAGFSIFLGALGSTSEAHALIMFAWFVGFSSIAWVLLPAIRYSKVTALVVGLTWIACGVYAANFGVPHVKGYPLSSWVVASAILLFFIVLRPPQYLGRAAHPIHSNAEDHDESKTAP